MGKALKIYSTDELSEVQEFLEDKIEKALDWKQLKFIFAEHHRASYLPATFIAQLQEKTYKILLRNSEYEDVKKCRDECQNALMHPIFEKPSLIRINTQKLLQALDEMVIPELPSKKRKRM